MDPAGDEPECMPPGSAPDAVRKAGPLACVLCGAPMFYDPKNLVYVCLNKMHGVLAYYAVDDCYFTSRTEVGLQFQREGRKFHMLPPEIMAHLGVEP